MVKGLAKFREHFSDFSEQYVLIGGAACDLAMNEAGMEFRGTKDLDIVLCAEVLSAEFGNAFWEFVKLGQYEQREKSSGEKQFYRFQKPATDSYPFMLELFSRSQDGIEIPEDCHLTPIPISDEVSSLSAILLDEVYYAWIKEGKTEIEGVSIAGPECIVPLKAIAWLDLTARKASGDSIDSRAIKKHKNDIFRLSQIIDPEAIPEVPEKIKQDLSKFMESMEGESIDLKALGIKGQSIEDIFKYFEDSYKLNS